jgi:hypothetical protein
MAGKQWINGFGAITSWAPTGGFVPFTPALLPGLSLWIDATNASSITKDGSDLVSAWNDLSGNARHFSASGTAKPLWEASKLNGNPGITFDGSNDYMETAASGTVLSSAAASYIYVVFTWNGYGANTYPRMLDWSTNVTQGGAIGFPQSDTNYGPVQFSCAGDYMRTTINGSTSALTSAAHKVLMRYTGAGISTPANFSLALDGTNQTPVTAPGGGGNYASGKSHLGACDFGGSVVQFSKVTIHEVFAGVGTLSAGNLTDIDTYISNKYAI